MKILWVKRKRSLSRLIVFPILSISFIIHSYIFSLPTKTNIDGNPTAVPVCTESVDKNRYIFCVQHSRTTICLLTLDFSMKNKA